MASHSANAYARTNRRGEVYYLQVRARPDGRQKYSFARKLTAHPLKRVPDGYEVYERPESAQVLIRKIKPSPILTEEEQAVRTAIRNLAGLDYFSLQKEGRSLTIYLPDIEPDGRLAILATILPMSAADARRMRREMLCRARYVPMMRFTLVDEERRLFNAERWCFQGSIDDWIFLRGLRPLPELLRTYAPHLGRESFFELM